ncbi:hypothetical protein [Kiloniella sp.]|uniref:hypothetical protein n=1 Tax=Kiloniella sp. TaxID=1938587 RepID=UPI003A9585CE
MLRWSILSTAKIGEKHVSPAILDANNAGITAIASRDKSKADVLAEHFSIPQPLGLMKNSSQAIWSMLSIFPSPRRIMWNGLSGQQMQENMCFVKSQFL